MIFSQQAWALIVTIFHAIVAHPFNQQLMHGTLPRDIFAYYIEQDAAYLHDFARFMEVIASKAPTKHRATFLKFADDARQVEAEIVHEHFRRKFAVLNTGHVSPALVEYTSFLSHACHDEPVEVSVAAILPCFWIYREVALRMKPYLKPNNPYSQWIESYTGDDYAQAVKQVIAIADELADNATPAVRSRMLEVFQEGAKLELRFWDDAYGRVKL
jgi:thiaminase/transcriptional activator TenA